MPNPKPEPTCENCKFAVEMPDGANGVARIMCRRNPPMALLVPPNDQYPAGAQLSIFPMLDASQWCGEWAGAKPQGAGR